ncbi:unnamed protein product [Darwinula stevensoni]|uniref:Uncharacterized protein n=1 Tax=Darwinula stevensoni TaxID=69355 RepID=A0A7R8XGB5_9CRUS|nr:unnamed protein product [Darwinula stevensoni]CAG0891338.1 unnamed protein product [Darwinula stevensoni]
MEMMMAVEDLDVIEPAGETVKRKFTVTKVEEKVLEPFDKSSQTPNEILKRIDANIALLRSNIQDIGSNSKLVTELETVVSGSSYRKNRYYPREQYLQTGSRGEEKVVFVEMQTRGIVNDAFQANEGGEKNMR